MSYLDCFILGFKGFLIVLGFAISALVSIGVLALIGSMFGIGKNKRHDV